MKALCQGPGRYTVSFVYAMMVNRFSCLRFGKQIGTARSSNADIGGN